MRAGRLATPVASKTKSERPTGEPAGLSGGQLPRRGVSRYFASANARSITFLNFGYGCAPLMKYPLMMKPGVPWMPAS